MNGETTSQSEESRLNDKKVWAEKRRIAELPFAELTVDQKFERVINAISDFQYITNRVAQVETKIHHLSNHSHNEQGVVVSINSVNNSSGLGGVAKLSTRNTFL